jgi:uncharacterized repeat protein (TIGR01451 family)
MQLDTTKLQKRWILIILGCMVLSTAVSPLFAQTITISDPERDVGIPADPTVPIPPAGTISGWDMRQVGFVYNPVTDVMTVTFDFIGIGGDADGDGDPNGTSAWLAVRGGVDESNFIGSESVMLLLDTDNDNHANVGIGVHDNINFSSFAAYPRSFPAGFSSPQSNFMYGAALPNTVNTSGAPSAGSPDLVFTIASFSTLPGFSFTPGQSFKFGMQASAGSAVDDGVGEESVPNSPTTIEVFSDWGDAPDTYSTLKASSGPSHTIVPGIRLGSTIDGEADGQPSVGAVNDGSDEDGVSFTTSLTRGLGANVAVTASVAGQLNAWIDYNDDGDFADAGEQIFSNRPLSSGVNNLAFTVPAGTTPTSQTYARFRFNTTGGLSYSGPATDGEVEDYEVQILDQLDFGDAPDTYSTLLAAGARHSIQTGFYLGAGIDNETNGQPTTGADGDDTHGSDDEDGVTLGGSLIRGLSTGVAVSASLAGRLDAWMDFNRDGDFGDAGEQIFTNTLLSAGTNNLSINVPSSSVPGSTYARYRFSSGGGLSSFGYASDGEVEDYRVDVLDQLDFGDAPDSYSTLLTSNGARHSIQSGFYLGSTVDNELDGQPTAGATGDDTNGSDDEDGVSFSTGLRQQQQASVAVTASLAGVLDAWIDYNNDGDFNDAGEKIFTGQALSAGVNNLNFNVPSNAQTGNTYSRFRFTSGGISSPNGAASNGEVEDYQVEILAGWDFGDAPDPSYPVLLASDGARHANAGVMLGSGRDIEANGQPTAGANGDDSNGIDDEDGVSMPAAFVQGAAASVTVNSSAAGVLNAWVDWNRNGSWADGGEKVFSDQVLAAGNNNLTINVPAGASIGQTYIRFRVNSAGSLTFTGAALDGEVEDYTITVEAADPDIHIEKATNGDDADNPTGPHIPVGDPVNWTYVVTNNGNVSLSNVVVTDDHGTPGSGADDFNPTGPTGDNGNGILDVGETWNYSFSGTAAAGQYENVADVQGEFGITVVTDDDTSHYYGDAYDFGDAPESGTSYPVTLSRNGARHILNGTTYLGAGYDNETDGQPNAGATGDDTNGTDDEDGVTFNTSLRQGQTASMTVNASTLGRLDVWIDFNDDGDWDDAGERVYNNRALSAGNNTLNFSVPGTAVQTAETFARFRFSSTGGLAVTGSASSGEVEDYAVAILAGQDFGDLPDSPYPTLNASNGARHDLASGFYLGSGIDADADGQPDAAAAGDDNDGTDDEDGVVFSTAVQGRPAVVTVTASLAGKLDGWVDFNNNGSFGDTGEHIFNNQALSAGANNMTFSVPGSSVIGQVYSRFRYSSTGGLNPDGAATDGEVEDYRITIEAPAPGIHIEKETNGDDADLPTGPYIHVDSTVTWTYTVTNTGNVPLSSVTVLDNIPGVTPVYQSGDNGNTLLEMTETWIFETTGTATLGQYTNIGHTEGTYLTSTVTDNDSSNYFGYTAIIDIEKATNGQDADDPTGPTIQEGDTVAWSYAVTNLGNVPLSNVTVTDDNGTPLDSGDDFSPVYTGGDINTNTLLDITETWTYADTCSAVIGQYENIGDVAGDDPNSITVTDIDTSHYIGIAAGSIGDYVWADFSGDGIQDATETGLEHIKIWLILGQSAIDSMETDSAGAYDFINLPANTYIVDVDESTLPYGYRLTTHNEPDTVILGPSQDYNDADFGYQPPRGSIGDYVWHDADGDQIQDPEEEGIPGVTIRLSNATWSYVRLQITDGDGLYHFTDLPADEYTVNVYETTLPPGYTITTNNEPHVVVLPWGEDYRNADFGYRSKPASIGDYVWEDANWDGIQDQNEPGLANITVVLLDTMGTLIASDSTNDIGYYIFENLEAGTYVVDVDGSDKDMPDKYVCTTLNDPMTVELSAGEIFSDADFGFMAQQFPLGVIGDYTWHDSDWDQVQDSDEDKLPYVYVFLYQNGIILDSVKTDFFGRYHFINLTAGNYFVKASSYGPNPAGVWQITTVDSFDVSLAPGEVYLDADFGFAYPEENWGVGRRYLFARYQPWYGNAVSDSTLRHWNFNFFGGQADTSLFEYYDSYDQKVWAYHILAAWACGIDGFAVDWHGEESYENPPIKGLLDAADFLYQRYHDKGFNFEIACSYNEMAFGELDENFTYIADSLMTHQAYWGTRRKTARPLFIYNDNDLVYTPGDYRTVADTTLPSDAFLLWNGTETDCFDPMDVCYPWVQPLDGQWNPNGLEWGESYLDTTYSRENYLPDPGDLLFALGGVWPGFDDREWSLGQNHWMDRQDTLVYHETWEKVHNYSYSLPMPWCLIETWNDFNQASEIEPSVDHDYKFNVLTRSHARRFKGSIPPDSIGVDNLGLLVPQHLHQATIAAELKPNEKATILALVEQATEYFFDRNHLLALSAADQAAGIAPNPLIVDMIADTAIQLSWEPSIAANKYTICYSTDPASFEPCSFIKPSFVSAGNQTQFTLTGLLPGTTYSIAITAADTSLGPYANMSWYQNSTTGADIITVVTTGTTGADHETSHLPQEFALEQNYPNPFNPVTTIEYALPRAQHVNLKLYDLQGREVAVLVNERKEAGFFSVHFDGSNLASSIYFYRIQTEDFSQVRKMILAK